MSTKDLMNGHDSDMLDWIALEVLRAELARESNKDLEFEVRAALADYCYTIAELMLERRRAYAPYEAARKKAK